MSRVDITPQPATTSAQGVVKLAQSSDVGTGTDNTKAVTPASMASHSGIAKAWVRFSWNGTTLTIIKSFNVSGVVRNSAGYWTVTFATALADTNYMIIGSTFYATGSNLQAGIVGWNNASIATVATTGFQFNTANTTSGNPQDVAQVMVAVFD